MQRILVINPNSTESMTASLEAEISCLQKENFQIDYFTAPSSAPSSINNNEDGKLSALVVMEYFESNPEMFSGFDGYLIACYSDHPLVNMLINSNRLKKSAIVMGIFQASMIYALNNANTDRKAAILTSGSDWEPLLDDAIISFTCTSKFPNEKFVNTLAASLPVLELHKEKNFTILTSKIDHLINSKNVKIILLGCAGLSTLSNKLKQAFPHIKFVDPVKTGITLLAAYIEIEKFI